MPTIRTTLAALLALLLFPLSARCDDLDAVLKMLDDRAAELEAQIAKDKGKPAHVAGLLSRVFGDKLDGKRGYTVSTFSFEHATRDDPKNVTRNDWDLLYGNGEMRFTVRTVTDDTSRIWDLGEADFDAMDFTGEKSGTGDADVPAKPGHLYVIHTVDSDSNLWVKLKVLEVGTDQTILFRWELLLDTEKVSILERSPDALMRSGKVRIQGRAGGTGGNPCRVFMNSKKWAYVDEIVLDPLNLQREIKETERAKAYVEGGFIPPGKAWVLTSVEYSGTNGGEPFVIRAAGQELARTPEKCGAFKDAWKGRIVIRPGQEETVSIEFSGSTVCEAVFHGVLYDAKWADTTKFPPLSKEDRKKADAALAKLESDNSKTRDEGVKELLAMGIPILDYLKGISMEKRSADFKARFKEVLDELQGE